MKTQLLKSLVYSLPLLVLVVISSGKGSSAQDKKEEKKQIKRTITITNGDTTVNGKAFSGMSEAEKEKIRKEFREMDREMRQHRLELENDMHVFVHPRGNKEVKIIRKRGKAPEMLKWRADSGGHSYVFGDKNARVFTFKDDSVFVEMNPDSGMKRFHIDSLVKFHGRIAMPRDFTIPIPNAVDVPRPRLFMEDGGFPELWGGRERANSQSFSFRSTDKDGITTRINISVSDASKEQVKKVTGKDAAGTLTIQDLTLTPSFTSGKVALMFALPSKGTANVKLLDNNLKPIFSESTSGSFSKQVMMPRNGVYYLVVFQNNQHAVKRIVKQ